MTRTLRSAALCLAVLAASCVGIRSDETHAVIQHWLTCEECVNGELAALRTLGASAIDPLSSALLGPPPEVLANIRRSSAEAYARASRYSLTLPPAERALRPLGDSAAFVARDVNAFRSLYQVRAARGLHAINPVRARTILADRLRQSDSLPVPFFRPEVRIVVDSLARTP